MAYRQTPAIKQRLDQTRARIVAAATKLVFESGYAGCSIAAVAEHAEVATGTIYRFFPSKGELFAEVFRTACAKEVAAASSAAQLMLAKSSPTEALVAAALTFSRRALKAPKLAYAMMAEPVDPLVEAERLMFRASYTDLFATGISTCVEQGLLPAQDPHIAAAGVVGAIGEVLVGPLGTGHPDLAVLAEIESFVRRAVGIPQHQEVNDAHP